MSGYKQVKQLSVSDAAWLAGLIDGEGTVTLSRKHRGDNRQLVVSISNTEIPMLKYAMRVIGAGKITRKRTSSARHTPSYAFSVSNRQGLDLLSQIEPYMKSYKADRARLAIKHYVRLTPRNGKYTVALTQERKSFIDEFMGILPHGDPMDLVPENAEGGSQITN